MECERARVAFILACEYRQPPYLISQLILQKHFSKHWEDEQYTLRKSKSESKKGKVNENNVKRITPVPLSSQEEFPSLKETCIKPKRVTPIAVQNFPTSNLSYSPTIDLDKNQFKVKTTLLSLSDVMVIKTKKNKKSAVSIKNKTDSDCAEISSKIVENLILDKDKNKLFERMLNRTTTKESQNHLDLDTENNNVNSIVESSHCTPKKAKLVQQQRQIVKTSHKYLGENLSFDIPEQADSLSTVTRVTPRRIEVKSAADDHLLSSIHFMTQNCHSKDELYESYRQKLERLNERFTNKLKTKVLPFKNYDDKEKIEKLSERMNSQAIKEKTKRPLSKVYLNTLKGSELSKALATLVDKINNEDKRNLEDSQEILMTKEDFTEWKMLVMNLQSEPMKLVIEATEFWKKFTANSKDVVGPKGKVSIVSYYRNES